MKLVLQHASQSSNTFVFVNENFGARFRNNQSKLKQLQLFNPTALKYECIIKRYSMNVNWLSVEVVSDYYIQESIRPVALFPKCYF